MFVASSRKYMSNTVALEKMEGLQDILAQEPLSTAYTLTALLQMCYRRRHNYNILQMYIHIVYLRMHTVAQ